jgi:hypothetical protein
MFACQKLKIQMESFVRMIQLLITAKFLAWKMKHCVLETPTHLDVKEKMNARKKQWIRMENFARILLFVTQPVNCTKSLVLVA